MDCESVDLGGWDLYSALFIRLFTCVNVSPAHMCRYVCYMHRGQKRLSWSHLELQS